MNCTKCGSYQVRVSSTRNGGARRIFRRRRCMDCGHRWTTIELPAKDLDNAVARAAREIKKLEVWKDGEKHPAE